MCKPHTGMACRFTLSPMSDNFVDIILGAIGKVDGSAVSQRTDKLSTVYRGSRAAAPKAYYCKLFAGVYSVRNIYSPCADKVFAVNALKGFFAI